MSSYTFNLSLDSNTDLSFEQLSTFKSQIESDLNKLFQYLNSLNADMNTPLKTMDDYPRQDIDIFEISKTRNRIIYLQNDYKFIINKLYNNLSTM